MQRYFASFKEKDLFVLNEKDSYHLKKVMRAKLNDQLEVVYDNNLYLCSINDISDLVKLEIISKLNTNIEKANIIIAQSLVIEKKMDLIIQKSTELGALSLIPYKAERSIVKLNDKDLKKKLDRWNLISHDASMQSKRLDFMEVLPPHTIDELLKVSADKKILLSVNEKEKNLKSILSNVTSYDTLLVVIGPEGGFSEKEEKRFMDNGFIRCSLGDLVLRSETASLALLSMINYHFMR